MRELGITGVANTKITTRILKDNLAKVDGNTGIVKNKRFRLGKKKRLVSQSLYRELSKAMTQAFSMYASSAARIPYSAAII